MTSSSCMELHGRFISRNSYKTIIFSLLLVSVALPGLKYVKIVSNPEQVWVPSDSKVSRQKKFFDDHFTPFFRINQAIFTVYENDQQKNLITRSHVQLLMDVQRRIIDSATSIPSLNENITIESLCFKPIDGEGCLTESPAQYWHSDPVILALDPDPSLTVACQTRSSMLSKSLPCFDEIGTPVMRNVVFGGLGVDESQRSPDPCGDKVPTASSMFLTFLLENFEETSFKEKAEKWEQDVFIRIIEKADKQLRNFLQSPMRISYMAGRSVEDSLKSEARQNVWVVVSSYVSMFIYVSCLLGKPFSRLKSCYKLAAVGLMLVACSFLCAISILSLFKLNTTLIVWEVVPFLALAIGVDNMFLIKREFDRIESGNIQYRQVTSVEINVGRTLANCGPSVVTAGLCEAVIFALGALTNIPALQQFCCVASLTILINLTLQFTVFIAALSLNARRLLSRKPEFDFLCSDAARTDEDDANSSRVQSSDLYQNFLFSNAGRVTTLIVLLALIVLGVIGVGVAELGLEPQLAAPKTSHLQQYYKDLFELGEAGPPAYIVLTDIDYFQVMTNSTRRQQINSLMTGVSQLSDYVELPLYSWIDSMASWINQRDSLGSSCPQQGILMSFGVVFLAALLLSDFLTSVIVAVLEVCMVFGIIGALLLWGILDVMAEFSIRVNAVSVCNLIMGVGISAEFLLHFIHRYHSTADCCNVERVKKCLKETGLDVFFGITLTKLVGVAILAAAPSHLFRLYFFRMYVCIIIVGAFIGLAVLPLVLSIIGSTDCSNRDYQPKSSAGGIDLIDEPLIDRKENSSN